VGSLPEHATFSSFHVLTISLMLAFIFLLFILPLLYSSQFSHSLYLATLLLWLYYRPYRSGFCSCGNSSVSHHVRVVSTIVEIVVRPHSYESSLVLAYQSSYSAHYENAIIHSSSWNRGNDLELLALVSPQQAYFVCPSLSLVFLVCSHTSR
jgi:hypothetical protein